MKLVTLSVLALMAAAGGASAAITTYTGPISQSDHRIVMDRAGNLRTQPVGFGDRGPAFVDIYDNVNTTALAGVSNADRFTGDLLNTTGTGAIREFEFSLLNAGTAVWTRTDISIIFLESDGVGPFNFLGQLDFDNVPVGLNPGFFTTLVITDPGITLTQTEVIAAVRFTDVQGIAVTQTAQIRANPVVVGSSDDTFLVADLGSGLTFAGFPSNNNVMYRIAVPAPGALALVGLGGLVAIRRRR